MMAAHLARIPAEIVDHIIDYLHAEPKALGICGLVCHNWLPCSRFHLFESVYLHPNNGLDFVSLTKNPHCTLISYVRDLDLTEGQGRSSYDKKWFNAGLPLLKVFPIRKLALHEVSWNTLYTESQATLFSMSLHLEHLHLSYCRFGSFDQLVRLLSAWPQLKRLQFFAVTCKIVAPSQRACPFSSLEKLEVDGGHVPQLLQWLLTSDPTPKISEVKFGCVIDMVQARCIQRFLAVVGPSVKLMELGFGIQNLHQPEEESDCRKVRF